MSESGHNILSGYYNQRLTDRIGKTWASAMRCQDGDDWDEVGRDIREASPENNKYLMVLHKYLPNKSSYILEVGAGDGSDTKFIMDDGYKNIVGITIGNKNIERAKKLYGIDLLYMDMHFTSFQNQTFDAVIGFQTFEHTPAPLLLGLEFNRILKPGGKIIMQVPMGEKYMLYEENPHHLNVLEAWQARNIMRRCGFENVVTDMSIHGMVIYGEKIGGGAHNNHFNDIVNGRFCE